LIVQSWRASDWSKSDVDSTSSVFWNKWGNDSIVTMVRANVTDKHFADVKAGWDDYYRKSWKKIFCQKNKK